MVSAVELLHCYHFALLLPSTSLYNMAEKLVIDPLILEMVSNRVEFPYLFTSMDTFMGARRIFSRGGQMVSRGPKGRGGVWFLGGAASPLPIS